jgi:hypothetical protein
MPVLLPVRVARLRMTLWLLPGLLLLLRLACLLCVLVSRLGRA